MWNGPFALTKRGAKVLDFGQLAVAARCAAGGQNSFRRRAHLYVIDGWMQGALESGDRVAREINAAA